MEDVVSERPKAFAAPQRSDEDRQVTFPLPDALRLSSPRLRHDRRLALLSRPNVTLNLCSLLFALSLALLPPLLISQTIPLPGSRLWFSPVT